MTARKIEYKSLIQEIEAHTLASLGESLELFSLFKKSVLFFLGKASATGRTGQVPQRELPLLGSVAFIFFFF